MIQRFESGLHRAKDSNDGTITLIKNSDSKYGSLRKTMLPPVVLLGGSDCDVVSSNGNTKTAVGTSTTGQSKTIYVSTGMSKDDQLFDIDTSSAISKNLATLSK